MNYSKTLHISNIPKDGEKLLYVFQEDGKKRKEEKERTRKEKKGKNKEKERITLPSLSSHIHA